MSIDEQMIITTLDFSQCTSETDMHLLMKEKLGFPDFYGENRDALWDCLTGFIGCPRTITIKGIKALSPLNQQDALRIVAIFLEAEQYYLELRKVMKIIVE